MFCGLLLIFSWNWCVNKCVFVGMPSRNVRFPSSVKNSEKRPCRQILSLAIAFRSITRASSNISRISSGPGSPSPSSSGDESRNIKADKIGLVTVINRPCCSGRPSSKAKTSLFFADTRRRGILSSQIICISGLKFDIRAVFINLWPIFIYIFFYIRKYIFNYSSPGRIWEA